MFKRLSIRSTIVTGTRIDARAPISLNRAIWLAVAAFMRRIGFACRRLRMPDTRPPPATPKNGDPSAKNSTLQTDWRSSSRRWLPCFMTLLVGIAACCADAQRGGGVRTPLATPPEAPSPPRDAIPFRVISTRRLVSDGPDRGRSAYDLIRAFGGSRSIEAPDMYPENHPEVAHIVEATDDVVGDHFVFVMHRDRDIDRNRVANTDRQRNEIKTYHRSDAAVKAFEGETFVLGWKLFIPTGTEVSKRFTHFFQLKAVGGPDSQPMVTMTGNQRKDGDGLEIRYSSGVHFESLQRVPWSAVTGRWLRVYCRATFADAGAIRLIAVRVEDGQVIFDIDKEGLDLWRGDAPDHFVRPKWGIYRSLRDLDNLRATEERIRFADFSISKVEPQD